MQHMPPMIYFMNGQDKLPVTYKLKMLTRRAVEAVIEYEQYNNACEVSITYTDNQQIIEDAAQMLIENHLQWSGSQKGKPSRDIDNVQGQVFTAYAESKLTYDEWDELDEHDQQLFRDHADLLFEKAAHLADRKWEAFMTLLGFEQ